MTTLRSGGALKISTEGGRSLQTREEEERVSNKNITTWVEGLIYREHGGGVDEGLEW